MSHPIVHAEIRSSDPDATRAFFGELFGWTYPTEGAFPGYTFVETGVPGALYTAISPLQGDSDLVTFFVGVEDIASAISRHDPPRRSRRPGAGHRPRRLVRADRRSPGSRRGPGPAALTPPSPHLAQRLVRLPRLRWSHDTRGPQGMAAGREACHEESRRYCVIRGASAASSR